VDENENGSDECDDECGSNELSCTLAVGSVQKKISSASRKSPFL
jgi:hypothetical protein